ncbi:MAG TPA: neutral/alkaline non-lysosomal ceramidase N-terminal domain-containing protein, partial [bacterium]|nr:neutral/alkaline non-lysosomal ceramidase N-terminal domain-containing protein [bacterium]
MRRSVFARISIVLFCLLVAVQSGILAAEMGSAGGGWKAGTARVDITPDSPMWMAGYAARTRPAEGTLQRLWAKAVAIEDASGERGVLVTTDLLGFPRSVSDTIRSRLQERLRLSRAQIILNSSHTHSGPVLRDGMYHIYPVGEEEIRRIERYTVWLEDQIGRLVERAIQQLEPAQIRFGTG